MTDRIFFALCCLAAILAAAIFAFAVAPPVHAAQGRNCRERAPYLGGQIAGYTGGPAIPAKPKAAFRPLGGAEILRQPERIFLDCGPEHGQRRA